MISFSAYPGDPRPCRTIDSLIKEGMTVELICLGDDHSPRREKMNGLSVIRIPIEHSRGGWYAYAYQYSAFLFVCAAILTLRSLRRRYSVVYIHNMPDVLVLSALVPKLCGAKVILDMHDPMPELMTTIFGFRSDSLSVRVLQRLEKWSMAFADSVVTVNQACKRIFSARSCRPEKISVVMNSPDEAIFPLRGAAAYDANNAARESFVIMYHGSLVERNGLDLAVDALSKVRDTIPGAELRICGRRTPFLDQVLDDVRSNGLQGRVHYLGPKRLEDLVDEISACDLGVIPNRANAFTEINTPTRIFEYLALGKPVIAPRMPGIEDYFGAGTLLFFEAGDSDDLARVMECAYSNPAETIASVERGQQVYLAHTWSEEKRALIDLVATLLRRDQN